VWVGAFVASVAAVLFRLRSAALRQFFTSFNGLIDNLVFDFILLFQQFCPKIQSFGASIFRESVGTQPTPMYRPRPEPVHPQGNPWLCCGKEETGRDGTGEEAAPIRVDLEIGKSREKRGVACDKKKKRLPIPQQEGN